MISKRTTLFALSFAVALAAPLAASAECDGRVFEGKVDKVNDKQIFVDNRKGDKLAFTKTDNTAVSGLKTKWEDIKNNDWVGVCSKMLEKPRKAYSVEVKNPPAETGVEE